jgi:hypothetical protein
VGCPELAGLVERFGAGDLRLATRVFRRRGGTADPHGQREYCDGGSHDPAPVAGVRREPFERLIIPKLPVWAQDSMNLESSGFQP